jgi:hypothetical protein
LGKLWIGVANPVGQQRENRWGIRDNRGSRPPKKKPPAGGFLGRTMKLYAVSPYTVTLMSTTTSVCRATETVLSPTVLMGPLGMRTWALATG